MKVLLIATTKYMEGSTEQLIEYAGRLCYRSQRQLMPTKFVRRRIKEGHESILEHASASFEISGISRACSHQLVRHRLASYSQESQRYVEMLEPEWVTPPDIAADSGALRLWNAHLEAVRQVYLQLRTLGIAKEDARFLLPNATATRLIMTANYRELLHIFRIRISLAAQWEIREVCVKMLELIYPQAPAVFGLLRNKLKDTYPSFF